MTYWPLDSLKLLTEYYKNYTKKYLYYKNKKKYEGWYTKKAAVYKIYIYWWL